jgi:hypothetical protein
MEVALNEESAGWALKKNQKPKLKQEQLNQSW